MIKRVYRFMMRKVAGAVSGSEYFSRYFFAKNRKKLVSDYYNYPSVINNGFLHIERAIEIARGLNIKGAIVDAGAANGVISMKFADSFPGSDVYCFEPIRSTFSVLSSNTSGVANIHLVNKALGSSPSVAEINILERITSSSILPSNDNIKDEFFSDALKKKNTESITVSTLDAEIPPVAVSILKMDVQGYELEILKGAKETLKRTGMVLLELQNHDYYRNAPNYHELDDFLRQSGFVLYDLIPSIRRNFKLLEFDAIYVSKMAAK